MLLGQKVSEYHTGYRAFSREVLEKLPLRECSDDFVFDNEMLAQVFYFGFRIGEISSPARYFPEASSISFRRSVTYGIGFLKTALKYRLQKWGRKEYSIFDSSGKTLLPDKGTAEGEETPKKSREKTKVKKKAPKEPAKAPKGSADEEE